MLSKVVIPTYSNQSNQQAAVNWLQKQIPTDVYQQFSDIWQGSTQPALLDVVRLLGSQQPQPHQAHAVSLLDAWLVANLAIADQLKDKWKTPITAQYVTAAQLTAILDRPFSIAQTNQLNNALDRLGGRDTLVIQHFLSQVLHETGGLVYTEEIASGQDYEYRSDLGNVNAGDGKLFKGSGGLQLTGRTNYTAFGKWVNDPQVVVQGCKYVAKRYFWESAVWYWNSRKISAIAKKDDIEGVTRAINGGLTALGARQVWLTKCKKVIK